jgi:ribonuclease-3
MPACSGEGGSLAPPDLAALQERLGHRFADTALLEDALTHRSLANEDGRSGLGNERLEFLGDAVLDLVVSELLMEANPDVDEGVLSRARAAAVNAGALAERARELDLGDFVRLGRGERRAGGAGKPSILADTFEALLGALYLDAGLATVRAFIERELAPGLSASEDLRDAKTRLSEEVQKQGCEVPRYQTVAERGPDHAKEFEVEVRVNDEVLGRGSGSSKRSAEQRAAQGALERLAANEA